MWKSHIPVFIASGVRASRRAQFNFSHFNFYDVSWRFCFGMTSGLILILSSKL